MPKTKFGTVGFTKHLVKILTSHHSPLLLREDDYGVECKDFEDFKNSFPNSLSASYGSFKRQMELHGFRKIRTKGIWLPKDSHWEWITSSRLFHDPQLIHIVSKIQQHLYQNEGQRQTEAMKRALKLLQRILNQEIEDNLRRDILRFVEFVINRDLNDVQTNNECCSQFEESISSVVETSSSDYSQEGNAIEPQVVMSPVHLSGIFDTILTSSVESEDVRTHISIKVQEDKIQYDFENESIDGDNEDAEDAEEEEEELSASLSMLDLDGDWL